MTQIGPCRDYGRALNPWLLAFTSRVKGEAYEYAELQLDEYTVEQIHDVRARAARAFGKHRLYR